MKFRITDENGCVTTVEELEDEEIIEETLTEDDETATTLTDDEIKSLKSLASVADKLIALANKDVADSDEEDKDKDITDEDEDEDEVEVDVEDEDEDEIEETVVDTDEDEDKDTMHDSVSSISKNKTKANDAIEIQDSIAEAWAKRYGGIK